MPINYSVQADVFDITNDTPANSDCFLVDTNVWFWTTYTKASSASRPWQVQHYPPYISSALQNGATIYRCDLTLAELAYRIEATECDIYKNAHNLSDLSPKEYRHNYARERPAVVQEIVTAWNQVKAMASCAEITINESSSNNAVNSFQSAKLDGYDIYILQVLSQFADCRLVSDDGDFATVSGISLHTANLNVTRRAASAGRLQTR